MKWPWARGNKKKLGEYLEALGVPRGTIQAARLQQQVDNGEIDYKALRAAIVPDSLQLAQNVADEARSVAAQADRLSEESRHRLIDKEPTTNVVSASEIFGEDVDLS